MKLTSLQKQLLHKERTFNELAKTLPETHYLQPRLKAAAKEMRAQLNQANKSFIIQDITNGEFYD